MGTSECMVGVWECVSYPCCHTAGGERGKTILIVNPTDTNNIHHIGWIIKSSTRDIILTTLQEGKSQFL